MKKEQSQKKKGVKGFKEKQDISEQQIQFYPLEIPMSKPASIGELKKFYEEELVRKDQIIEDLKKERGILLRTAMKQAERASKLNALLSNRGKKEEAKK